MEKEPLLKIIQQREMLYSAVINLLIDGCIFLTVCSYDSIFFYNIFFLRDSPKSLSAIILHRMTTIVQNKAPKWVRNDICIIKLLYICGRNKQCQSYVTLQCSIGVTINWCNALQRNVLTVTLQNQNYVV